MKDDAAYTERICKYLSGLFRENIDMEVTLEGFDLHGGKPDHIADFESDDIFLESFMKDCNIVARRKNMHEHSATCYKMKWTTEGQCRFGCPWPLKEKTALDDRGEIQML